MKTRSCVFALCLTSAASSAHFWCHKAADGTCVSGPEDSFSKEDLQLFVNSAVANASFSTGTVDASTIKNKVLAGYQGWVGANGDSQGTSYGWRHWSNNGGTPSASNAHFEMVPEMAEYPSSATFPTNLQYHDGSNVRLYSNIQEGVVDLHFKWMKDYGMDGVLIQRFISEVTSPGAALTQRNTVLAQMDDAAAKHGRVYAMMWDMSGAKSSWDQDIKNDFNQYVKQYTTRQQYLKEGGRPVVCIFGIGLSSHQQATASSSLALIRWLQQQGLYVIGSGPYYWRTGDHDALSGFDEVHAAFDAVMPWAVGRYNTVSDFQNRLPTIQADAQLTRSRNQGYAPIAYAGYSYRDSGKINFIKRNAGQFFQAQANAFLNLQGATFYYIAMFDEVQEGTAIYKFAKDESESAKGAEFVTASIDGVACPGDLYLTLAGQYTAAAHGGPSPSPGPSPPAPGADSLVAGDRLEAGSHLVSASGQIHLEMQGSDGNLVLYAGNSAIWTSGTAGHAGAHLSFQASDGNLVLYDGSSPLWSSGPHTGATSVQLQDDCNLVARDVFGSALWSLGTHCSTDTLLV